MTFIPGMNAIAFIRRCPRSCAGLEGWPRVRGCCHPSRLALLAPQDDAVSQLRGAFVFLGRGYPACERIQNFIHDVAVMASRPRQHVKGMIGAVDEVQFCRWPE